MLVAGPRPVARAASFLDLGGLARPAPRRPQRRAAAAAGAARRLGEDGPSLGDFIAQAAAERAAPSDAAPLMAHYVGDGAGAPFAFAPGERPPAVYLETYGCQMNSADAGVILAVLTAAGFQVSDGEDGADVVLLNTCSVRDGAEQKVRARLQRLRKARPGAVLGVLGCMAERLKDRLLAPEVGVSLVAGPDAYRDLPRLLRLAQGGQRAVNVQLSQDETYADIAPVRRDPGSPSAFVSITRGCNNMCSYCIVPFTRGRERSRPAGSIEDETRALFADGVREVCLLGQNVNSYWDRGSEGSGVGYEAAEGFSNLYRSRGGASGVRFAELLERVADISPELRVRFTAPHPKDFPDPVLDVIAKRHNVCAQLHMPAQHGSTAVLARMRRGYSREAYLALVHRARDRIPSLALSTDLISGFCGETEAEHGEMLSLVSEVRFEKAYMFAYSEREKTHAFRHLADDVPEPVKLRRLQEVVAAFRAGAAAHNRAAVGTEQCVLVDGVAMHGKHSGALVGRTDANRVLRLDGSDAAVPVSSGAGFAAADAAPRPLRAGDYVRCRATDERGGAEVLERTTLQHYARGA